MFVQQNLSYRLGLPATIATALLMLAVALSRRSTSPLKLALLDGVFI